MLRPSCGAAAPRRRVPAAPRRFWALSARLFPVSVPPPLEPSFRPFLPFLGRGSARRSPERPRVGQLPQVHEYRSDSATRAFVCAFLVPPARPQRSLHG